MPDKHAAQESSQTLLSRLAPLFYRFPGFRSISQKKLTRHLRASGLWVTPRWAARQEEVPDDRGGLHRARGPALGSWEDLDASELAYDEPAAVGAPWP
eukprot:5543749-Pyramimonas_sp.AAC.1